MAFATPEGKAAQQKRLVLRVSASDSVLQSPLYLNEAPTAIFKIEAKSNVSFAIEGAAGESYWLQVIKLDGTAIN